MILCNDCYCKNEIGSIFCHECGNQFPNNEEIKNKKKLEEILKIQNQMQMVNFSKQMSETLSFPEKKVIYPFLFAIVLIVFMFGFLIMGGN